MDISVGLEGFVRAVATKKNGVITKESSFENIVLDVGWQNFKTRYFNNKTGGYDHLPRYLYLGTGTTEPDASDGGLESVSGSLPGKLDDQYNSPGSYSGGVDAQGRRYCDVELRFEYGEGEAEGVWTELGLAYGDTYTDPYNRALFRDEQGNAVSFQILSDEFLTVYFTLRLTVPDFGAISGTTTFNGESVSFDAGFTTGFHSWGPYSGWGMGMPSYFFANAYNDTDGASSLAASTIVSEDEATLTRTFSISIDPGDNDHPIKRLFGHGKNDNSSIRELMEVEFTPEMVKPADHKIADLSFTLTMSRATDE